MIRSKSFDTQDVREIGRKEAGESRGFPILCMGIMEDVFQMKGKKSKVHERLKMGRRKSMPEQEDALAWDRQLCLGQWQWREKVRGSRKKFSRREGRAEGRVRLRKDSLCLCYAGSLTEKR